MRSVLWKCPKVVMMWDVLSQDFVSHVIEQWRPELAYVVNYGATITIEHIGQFFNSLRQFIQKLLLCF